MSRLDCDWMWRFYSDALASEENTVIIQAIELLNTRVRRDTDPRMYNLLQKNRVPSRLNKLTGHMSENIQQQASYLLDYILGPLAGAEDRPL